MISIQVPRLVFLGSWPGLGKYAELILSAAERIQDATDHDSDSIEMIEEILICVAKGNEEIVSKAAWLSPPPVGLFPLP